jgi:hypothetical protein
MLLLRCSAEVAVMEPDVDVGFVTWLEVVIERRDDDDAETEIGRAKLALIHLGEVYNQGEDIAEVLDADSRELCDLHDVFFDGDELRPAYVNGGGLDLLYVAEIEVAPEWQGRMIEEAVVRRLGDAWGGSCNVIIMPVEDLVAASRWERVGFTMMALTPSATRTGYVALDPTLLQPRIVPVDLGKDAYMVERLKVDAESD